LFYIQCGLASFVTLSALAVTSNGRVVRKLGGKRWKKLHRILYLAIPALLYHKGWAGKASPDQIREALVWFAPMLLLQAVRLTKFFNSKKTS
jgi:sulfoxide reductase heme-binding subunit YedZ